jgi:MSHA biogenesis protein MshP
MKPRAQREKGFALMAAVFILVTLAAISVYLMTISTGQLAAATQDEQASRAYQAARTGIEWGAYQLLRNSGVGFGANCTGGGGTASQTLSLGAMGVPGGTVSYFAEVTCNRVGSETEGGTPVSVYRVTVTGCNRATCGTADATYVERQLQLTLSL